ncbi:MAG: prohibitin family protein [Clostridia bacterium]|nr:prohibitin family protein [Clostridia bacterium]
MNNFKKIKGIIVVVVLAVIIGALAIDIMEPVYGLFGKVPTGQVGIVTVFGKVQDTVLEEGFHVKNPFAKITTMDVRTQKSGSSMAAFSSDIQQVQVEVSMNYSVNKATAMNLFREVGVSYVETVIEPRVSENVKVVIARYDAESLVEQRERLSTEILELMKEDMDAYGINVSAVSIEDIDFTDAFTTAVEDKQVATQNKLAAETEQARLTMEAEAEAERKVILAQAQAEIAKIEADNEAYAITAKAQAEAEANTLVAESLTDELIAYTEATNWNGQLPTFVGAEGVMPIIDSSVIGAGQE